MVGNKTAIPRRLHRLVIKACSEMDAPPYFWDHPEHKGQQVPADWKIARAIIVGVANEAGYTRQMLDMHPSTWDVSLAVWDELDPMSRTIFGGVNDMRGVEFRGLVTPEDC